jgi:hypothetical protein
VFEAFGKPPPHVRLILLYLDIGSFGFGGGLLSPAKLVRPGSHESLVFAKRVVGRLLDILDRRRSDSSE